MTDIGRSGESLHPFDDKGTDLDVTFHRLLVEGVIVPRISEDLVDVFASGLLVNEQVTLVLALATVDLFVVAGLGYLIVRQTPEFDESDWQMICAHLPAGTFIDPGEWEQILAGTEVLFIPTG